MGSRCPNLSMAERLAALEALNGGKSHLEELDISWKKLLLAQHHDIQICGLLPEARKLLPVSISQSEQSINESMTYFTENMKGEGIKQVIVFNPLSRKQTRWVFANVGLNKGDAKNFVAKCGDKIIPVKIITSNKLSDGSILEACLAFMTELPPLSLTSFSIIAAAEPDKPVLSTIHTDENNLVTTTPYYEIKLSEEGGLTSKANLTREN